MDTHIPLLDVSKSVKTNSAERFSFDITSNVTMIATQARVVQYTQRVLTRLRYLTPNTLTARQKSTTAQNVRTVCHALGIKSGLSNETPERISWDPPKVIAHVDIQFPTSRSQPVTQEVMAACFGLESIKDQ